ncbi:MAG: hypothetical protein KDA65_10875 [Planctomycetaceae bacterium]|nr:hypothetical protein [Planctomycetaceae bacterium]
MARNQKWVLYWEQETWQLYRLRGKQFTRIEPEVEESTDESARLPSQQIWTALQTAGYKNESLLMALGGNVCVQERFSIPTPRTARNRTALSYLFEPELPWSAEEIAHDYQIQGGTAYAVATETAPLAELITALEKEGVRINSITPQAELAVQHHLKKHPKLARRYLLFWQTNRRIHVWNIEKGEVVSWEVLVAEPEEVQLALKQILLTQSGPLQVAVREIDPKCRQVLEEFKEVELLQSEWSETTDFMEVGLKEALPVLSERQSASIEFYRDGLVNQDPNRPIRSYLGLVQVSFMALLLLSGWGLWRQAEEYDRIRKDYGAQQTELYRQVFPEQRARVGVMLPLQQELKRLRGLQGEEGSIPETVSALEVLLPLLEGLPEDFRFQLQKIDVRNGRLDLTGLVREHTDGDRFAKLLRKAGLQVESPRTIVVQNVGIEFRLQATLPTPVNAQEPTS